MKYLTFGLRLGALILLSFQVQAMECFPRIPKLFKSSALSSLYEQDMATIEANYISFSPLSREIDEDFFLENLVEIPVKGDHSKHIYGITGSTFFKCSGNSTIYNPAEDIDYHSLDGFHATIKPGFFIAAGVGDGCGGGHMDPYEDQAIATVAYKASRLVNEYIVKNLYQPYFVSKSARKTNHKTAKKLINIANESLKTAFTDTATTLINEKDYNKVNPTTTLLSFTAFPYVDKDNQEYYYLTGFNFGDSAALLYSREAQKFHTLSSGMHLGGGVPTYPRLSDYSKEKEYRSFSYRAEPEDIVILCSDGVSDNLPQEILSEGESTFFQLNDEEITQTFMGFLQEKAVKLEHQSGRNIGRLFSEYSLHLANEKRRHKFSQRNSSLRPTFKYGGDFTLLGIELPPIKE